MILEPNRQRRRKAFRISAGLVAIAMVGVVLSTGWLPSALSLASASPSPGSSSIPAQPGAVVPTPTPAATAPTATGGPIPQPSPTLDPAGCMPPPEGLEPAKVFNNGARTKKVVALTFDDGNDSDNVRRILNFLVKFRVNATFFPTGRAVELAPVTWLMVARAGFPIGNHTFHHKSLATMCYQAQVKELSRAVETFRDQALPLQAIMRPPYEAFDKNTRYAAAATGAEYIVLWDVDTVDWTGIGRQAIANRAQAGTSGSIILLHTDSRSTTAALSSIVSNYRKRGFTFVTVQQLIGVPGPVPFS